MQHGLILGGGRGIAAGYMAETTGSTETRSGVSFADACVCCRQRPLFLEVAEVAAFAADALADAAVAEESAYSFQVAASAGLVVVVTTHESGTMSGVVTKYGLQSTVRTMR